MRTVLDIACTGTKIQNWIEVRLCEIGSDHATRVAGNAKYEGADALVPENGYPAKYWSTMYDADSIHVLAGLAGVRLRPEVFLGEVTPFGLLRVVLIALATGPECARPTTIRVEILADGAFRIECDAPVASTTTTQTDGIEQPCMMHELLELYGPQPDGFAGTAPVVNAFSEFMRLTVTHNGKTVTAETSRGGVISPIRSQIMTGPDRSTIEFVPDSKLLESGMPEPHVVVGMYQQQQGEDSWPALQCERSKQRLNVSA